MTNEIANRLLPAAVHSLNAVSEQTVQFLSIAPG